MGKTVIVAWDTETALLRAGKMAPELACLTYQTLVDGEEKYGPHIVPTDTDGLATIHDLFVGWLRDEDAVFVGQNVAYDFGVLCAAFPDLTPVVFAAYKAGRITDTKIRQQLTDIANGCYRGYLDSSGVWHKHGYSLFDLVRRHTEQLLRKDGWRLRYSRFINVPLDQWVTKAMELQAEAKVLLEREAHKSEKERYYDGLDPKDLIAILEDPPEQCIQYPLDDASTTLDVYLAQEAALAAGDPLVEASVHRNEGRETYAAFVFHLCSAWGIRTSGKGVDELEVETRAAMAEVHADLVKAGLVREDGSRDTKAAAAYMVEVCEREEIPLRKTKTGGVCLDKDACDATDDPLMMAYSEFSQLGKTTNADIPLLRSGTQHPVHCRYDLAETLRVTCSGPNLQNLRSKVGIRECFVPRPGCVFLEADYPTLELYTLAQSCYSWFGRSTLGDQLKSGIDPHTAFAAHLMGIPYEKGLEYKESEEDETFNRCRKIAKVFNFGKPGGLGTKKLVTLAASKQYRVDITEAEAKRYSKEWFEMFPEMPSYFAAMNGRMHSDGYGNKVAELVIPGTGFMRGGARYCAACNTSFQHLGAACAKSAMCKIAEAEYVLTGSPLYGARTVAMIHDELIVECPESRAHDAAQELARLMAEGANVYLPDCPIPTKKIKPLAMRQWSKKAKQVFDNAGRLVPWDITMLSLRNAA